MTTVSGWITPAGRFEPLDGLSHEGWLEGNTDIGTGAPVDIGVDFRQLALNRGYARCRQYGGKLTIEVGAAFFRGAVKRAISRLLEDRAEDFDFVTVQLLNDRGAVVKSAAVQVFDADCPAAAALSVLEKIS